MRLVMESADDDEIDEMQVGIERFMKQAALLSQLEISTEERKKAGVAVDGRRHGCFQGQ